MKRNRLSAITVVLLAVVYTMLTSRSPSNTTTSQEGGGKDAILVKDLTPQRVIGHLGHPLGTVVRVTGTALDADTTRRKADAGKAMLRIEAVNGLALDPHFLVPVDRAEKGVVKPKPGESFDYYVHEHGEFDGVVVLPSEVGIERPVITHDGFQYRARITIHKTLLEP